jgi:hypothetical protein
VTPGNHVTLGRERPSGSICDFLAAIGGGKYVPTRVPRVLAVSQGTWSPASASETHQYENGLRAGIIRYTVDAVARCSTGVFTLGRSGSSS